MLKESKDFLIVLNFFLFLEIAKKKKYKNDIQLTKDTQVRVYKAKENRFVVYKGGKISQCIFESLSTILSRELKLSRRRRHRREIRARHSDAACVARPRNSALVLFGE